MANRKISELTSRTPALSDLMLVGDPSSGYSYKCTVTALATIIETDIADGFVTIGTTQTVSGAKTFSNNLTLTSVANTPTDPDKFLTLNASNVVTYRTGSQVLSDIGAQGSITLTTTGTSGAATLVGSTLNIPQYQSVLTNPVTGTGTTNYVTKWTSSSAVGNSQIIDNGTAIGIGTAPSNAYLLSVAGIYRGVGVGNAARIELYDTQSGGATFFISPQESLGVTSLGTYGAFPILFITNATERIRIASAGDVTISTIANATVDTDKFLVSDSGVIKYRTGAEVLSDIGGASSSSISGTTNYIPKFTSSSAIGNSVIYESSSNIGIGTTSPTYKLSVNGGIATTNDVTASTGSLGVLFGTASSALGSSDLGFIVADNNGYGSYNDLIISPRNNGAGNQGNLRVYTSGSERLRISSTGNVSIGNTNNTYKLDVTGTGNFTNDSEALRLISSDANGNYITFRNSSSAYAYIGSSYHLSSGSASDLGIRSQSNLVFSSGGSAERMRLDASGNLGLGVTPSAWNIGTALEIANGPAILGFVNETFIANNAYYNGGWKYRATATAQAYFMNGGEHKWQIAASGTAGNAISFTQAMTLDASGRLGIGTTSPVSILDIGATSDQSIAVKSSNSNYAFYGSFTDFALIGINRNPSTGAFTNTSKAAASIALNGSNANSYIIFETATANNTAPTERMRITSGGNVGIGTTSPATIFDAVGIITTRSASLNDLANPTEGIRFGWSSGGGDATYRNSIFNNISSSAGQGLMQFRVNNGISSQAIVMSLLGSGNVGIGTTSPNTILDVNGTINVRTNGYEFGRITTNNVTGNFGGLTFQYNASGTFTSGMVLTGGGNVGIGTSSPSNILHAVSSLPRIISETSSQYAVFNLYASGSEKGAFYLNNTAKSIILEASGDNTYYLQFNTASTEKMRITSGGELLINTTSDAGDYKLQVNGAIYSTNGTAENIWMNDGIASSSLQQASNIFFINGNASSATHASIVFRSSSAYTERMRITSGGNVEITTGSIKTGAPSGGTAKPWKLGEAGVTLGGSNTSGVRVEIDGTVYYLVTGYLP